MNIAQEIAQNPKTASVIVGGATTASGTATALEWVSAEIGVIASILGIVLTSILIVVNIKKELRDKREHKLKIELLERQLKDK